MLRFVKSTWHGDEPLWKAFWLGSVYDTVAMTLVCLMYFALHAVGFSRYLLLNLPLSQWAVLLLSIPITCWTLLSIYRCSKRSQLAWRLLAQAFVFIAAVRYLGIFYIVGVESLGAPVWQTR